LPALKNASYQPLMNSQRALLPVGHETDGSRLFTLIGIVVAMAGLYFGRQVLIPLALSVVFAFLLTPFAGLLEKCHLGRVPSVLAVLILSMALLASVGWGVTNQLMEIVSHLSDYKANIHSKVQAIHAPRTSGLSKATATVNDLGKELSAASDTAENKNLAKNGKPAPIAVQVAAPPHTASEFVRDLVGPLTGTLETAGIVVIFTLFILIKREDLRNRLLRLAGSGRLNVMTDAFDEASHRLGRYLLLQFAVNASYGLLFGLGVYLIGIPHPLLWGVLGALLRFVPYVGTAVAAVFPMVMALAVFPGWFQVSVTFLLFLLLEVTIANLVEPWLYGAHVGVSSLAILVAAIFWGMIWGPLGLILSTPLTVCLILVGRYIPQLSFLEILLGDEPVLSPHVHLYQRLLAFDHEEAREIVDKYLRENPVGNLYDSVLIPALSLAEKDRYRNVLDEARTKFIYQSTRELIDEADEVSQSEPSPDGESSPVIEDTERPSARPRIACIPARDEADEIVGTMLVQLLQRAKYDAEALPAATVSTMLERVEQFRPDTICVSALSPFPVMQAKSLCKQIRRRWPAVKLVLGLWEFPGGIEKAEERVGFGCTDMIGTTVAQVVSLMAEGPENQVDVAEDGSDWDAKARLA
jgi:predicted PurR-regulated permease PerM